MQIEELIRVSRWMVKAIRSFIVTDLEKDKFSFKNV